MKPSIGVVGVATILLIAGVPLTGWGESFTFLVWSDTHYGYNNSLGTRDNCVGDMNGIPGTAYPAPFAGIVDTPAFIIHNGDITTGQFSHWQNTTPSTNDDYVSGRALLHWPSYEVMGNDDHLVPEIRVIFVERYGHPWYSFDHEGVHFVMLDSLDAGTVELPFFGAEQLAWLAADLAAVGTTRPVIVVMHYYPSGSDPDEFGGVGDALAGYNIVAILHGHYHSSMHNIWRGWDIWGTGQTVFIAPSQTTTFSVVRIARGRLQVVPYDWNGNAWFTGVTLDKPITGLTSGAPRIFVHPVNLAPTTRLGSTPAADTFTVTNVGDETLEYHISPDATWVHVSTEDGSSTNESDSVEVTYDVAGLGVGRHTAMIRVESGAASNSPQTIGVNLQVCPETMEAPTNLAATPTTVCPGGTIQLSATAGAGGDTVEWFTGGCGVFAVPGDAAPLVVLNEATTFYARTRHSDSGCVSDTCASMAVHTITPPASPSSAVAAPATTCSGGSVRLSATPGDGGDGLAWYADTCGGTPISGGSSPTVHPTASSTYYAKTANNTTGCTSTGCVSVVVTVQNRVGPDLNGDCHVSADDLAEFVACMTGTHVGGMSVICHNADFDLDNDVDQSDFGILQRCLSGGAEMADPNCGT